MAIELINVGDIPNDGTGDDLRVAFVKVNNSLEDLDARVTTASVNAETIGTTGEAVYAGRDNDTLQFKSLIGGSNVSLSSTATSIVIDAAGGLDQVLVVSDNGSIQVTPSNYLGINGGEVISTRVSGSNLFIDLDTNGVVARDSNPTLSANLNANNFNIANASQVNSASFVGPLTGLVYGVDIRNINEYFDNYFDFGGLLNDNYNNIIDVLIATNDVDLGAFIGSEVVDFNIDLGPIAP